MMGIMDSTLLTANKTGRVRSTIFGGFSSPVHRDKEPNAGSLDGGPFDDQPGGPRHISMSGTDHAGRSRSDGPVSTVRWPAFHAHTEYLRPRARPGPRSLGQIRMQEVIAFACIGITADVHRHNEKRDLAYLDYFSRKAWLRPAAFSEHLSPKPCRNQMQRQLSPSYSQQSPRALQLMQPHRPRDLFMRGVTNRDQGKGIERSVESVSYRSWSPCCLTKPAD